MSKHEKVPATQKQIGELAGVLVGEMNFSKDEAQKLIENLGEFRREVRAFYDNYKLVLGDQPEFVNELARWWGNFEKLFHQVPDFSDIIIPSRPEGLGPMRLIIVPKEIITWTGDKPLQGTMDALKKHFLCRQDIVDLDKAIVKNDRDPRNGSYALWVKDVREADEENANQSAKDLKEEGHKGMTLLERMLFEADYFFEHGEHLDLQNFTLVTGSRFVSDVLYVSWSDEMFGVHYHNVSSRSTHCRSRTVYF